MNLTGLVIPPGEIEGYFEEIEREKKRAWAKYDLMLMTGVEFNKDGYTAKTSTHLLGVDLKQPIDPSLDIKQLIAEIHGQGGLAIASHPHEMKSEWGKDTLYLWEHVDEYAPLIDAWEVANRDDIFNPVGAQETAFRGQQRFSQTEAHPLVEDAALLRKGSGGDQALHPREPRCLHHALSRSPGSAWMSGRLELAALEGGHELVEFEQPSLAATQG